ncbi:MAG: DUF4124 domain-containing protein [Wenzhouxiangella sp.]
MGRFFLLAILLGLALAAQAQTVYRWTDENGLVHYGHAVPPEYRARGYDRMAPDGRILERIAPAMTAEERAEKARREALQEQLEVEQQNQAARDRLLLAAYRNEEDLQQNLEWRLNGLQGQLDTLAASLQHSRQRLEDLIARAAGLHRTDQPVPAQLDESIEAARTEIRRLNEAMAEIQIRKEQTRQRFESDLERYRALRRD